MSLFLEKKVVQVLLSNERRFRFGTRVSLVFLKCHLLPWTALKLLLLCTEVIPSLRLRCLLEVQCWEAFDDGWEQHWTSWEGHWECHCHQDDALPAFLAKVSPFNLLKSSRSGSKPLNQCRPAVSLRGSSGRWGRSWDLFPDPLQSCCADGKKSFNLSVPSLCRHKTITRRLMLQEWFRVSRCGQEKVRSDAKNTPDICQCQALPLITATCCSSPSFCLDAGGKMMLLATASCG